MKFRGLYLSISLMYLLCVGYNRAYTDTYVSGQIYSLQTANDGSASTFTYGDPVPFTFSKSPSSTGSYESGFVDYLNGESVFRVFTGCQIVVQSESDNPRDIYYRLYLKVDSGEWTLVASELTGCPAVGQTYETIGVVFVFPSTMAGSMIQFQWTVFDGGYCGTGELDSSSGVSGTLNSGSTPTSTPTFTPTATPTRTPTPTFTPTATATPKPKLPPVGITGEVVDYDTIHYKLLNTDFATPYNWYGTEYIQVVISIPTKPLHRLRYFTLAAIQEGGVAIWLSDDVPAGCGSVTIRARALAYSYAPYQNSDESTATILMPPAPTSTPTVPTSTSTPTTTNTPTVPLGSTPTFTPTRTNTVPPTNTLTPTVSVNTPTNTSTVIPGSTATPTPSYTQTPIPTNTPTPTVPTNTPTNTATSTPTPTVPLGSTPTFTPTEVVLPPTPTLTPSHTPTPANTPTGTPTATPTVPTSTPTSSTPSPTATPDSSYKVDVFVDLQNPVNGQTVVWGDSLYCFGSIARKSDDFPDSDVDVYYAWGDSIRRYSALKPGQERYVTDTIDTMYLSPGWQPFSLSSYATGLYESYWQDNSEEIAIFVITPTPTRTPTRTPTPTFTPTKTPTSTPTPLLPIRPLEWVYALPRSATEAEVFVMFHADSLADWPISNFASFKWGYDPDNDLTDTSAGLSNLTGIIPEWQDTMVSSGEMVFDTTAVAIFGANNETYPPGRQSTWLKYRWVPTPTPIPGATPTPTEVIPTSTPLPPTGTFIFRKVDGGIGAFVESM